MAKFLHKLSESEGEILQRIIHGTAERLSLLAGQAGERLNLPAIVWMAIDEELTVAVASALVRSQRKAMNKALRELEWV